MDTINRRNRRKWSNAAVAQLAKTRVNTAADTQLRESDSSEEVMGWEDETNVVIDTDRNDQIVITTTMDLKNYPAEAFQSVVVAGDLTREQMMEVCRITKPAGRILRGI